MRTDHAMDESLASERTFVNIIVTIKNNVIVSLTVSEITHNNLM